MFSWNFPDHLPGCFWFRGRIQSVDIFLPAFFIPCLYCPASFSPIQLIVYQIGCSGLFLQPLQSSSLQSDRFLTFIVELDRKKGSSKVFGWICSVWPSWVWESQHASTGNSVSWSLSHSSRSSFHHWSPEHQELRDLN